jgi:uncharacterized membrane protein
VPPPEPPPAFLPDGSDVGVSVAVGVSVGVDVSVAVGVSVGVDVSVAVGVATAVAVAVAVALSVRLSAVPDSTIGVPPYPNPEVRASVPDSVRFPVSPVEPAGSCRSGSPPDSWNHVPVAAAVVPVSAMNVRRESLRSSGASLSLPIVCTLHYYGIDT